MDRVGLAIDTAVALVQTGAGDRCRLATDTGAGQALAAAGWVLTLGVRDAGGGRLHRPGTPSVTIDGARISGLRTPSAPVARSAAWTRTAA